MAHRCIEVRKRDQFYIYALQIPASISSDVGVLLGVSFATTFMPEAADEVAVVGCCACLTYRDGRQPEWQEEAEFVKAHYPAGVCPCGIFLRGKLAAKAQDQHKVKEVCKRLLRTGSGYQFLFSTEYVLVAVLGTPEEDSMEHPVDNCYLYNTVTNKVSSVSPIIVTGLSQWYEDKSVILRLLASFYLEVPATDNVAVAVKEGFMKKETDLRSHGVTLYIPSFGITMSSNSYIGSDRMLQTVADLWELHRNSTDKEKLKPLSAEVLNLELLYSTDPSPSSPSSDKQPMAPITSYHPHNLTHHNIPIPVDVVAMLSLTTPFIAIYDIILEGISLQLKQIEKFTLWKETELCTVNVDHFVLPNHHCPVTMVYPCKPQNGAALKDCDLVDVRRPLHDNFMLPNNRPYLRHANRITAKNKDTGHLMNVHIGVKPPGIEGGTIVTVNGSYSYYHYMQDGMNDKGWGCAYRSLQTLWSWYLHQGYTTKPVPNHKVIQQALVDSGDKPPSLVDSKQWIGSFEVSVVLNHLLGVSSKILHVPSGAEMGSQGRQLLLHFRTHGTPIMIGGGVLAHTILGVCYNSQTGDIKFLILDPHYTGEDELNTILKKGWCSWKKVDFWDKEAHYNLCMPQLIDEI